jgi:uncharacterized membrane protein YhaH (DUF805 family)
MTFPEAVRKCVRHPLDAGRAPRSEYWWFQLFLILAWAVVTVVVGVMGAAGSGPGTRAALGLSVLVPWLFLIICAFSVTIRRLHDTGRTGLWIFIGLVPILGTIVMLVFMVMDGEPGPNRWGPPPGGSGWNPPGPYGASPGGRPGSHPGVYPGQAVTPAWGSVAPTYRGPAVPPPPPVARWSDQAPPSS